MQTVVLGLRRLLVLVLAAFFGFVGWMKAFAPLPTLREHHAWTVWIPEPLGRAVGWSEMIGALLLAASLALTRVAGWQRMVALCFVANQLVAAATHLAVGERGALPQNAVLIAAFAVLAVTGRPLFDPQHARERSA